MELRTNHTDSQHSFSGPQVILSEDVTVPVSLPSVKKLQKEMQITSLVYNPGHL